MRGIEPPPCSRIGHDIECCVKVQILNRCIVILVTFHPLTLESKREVGYNGIGELL